MAKEEGKLEETQGFTGLELAPTLHLQDAPFFVDQYSYDMKLHRSFQSRLVFVISVRHQFVQVMVSAHSGVVAHNCPVDVLSDARPEGSTVALFDGVIVGDDLGSRWIGHLSNCFPRYAHQQDSGQSFCKSVERVERCSNLYVTALRQSLALLGGTVPAGGYSLHTSREGTARGQRIRALGVLRVACI